MSQTRVPGATYRLQFHAGFGFSRGRGILAYLRTLGVTDVYASPISRARSGSTHGYDVADPSAINPELGSAEEFEAFAEEARRKELGLLLDIVPNHMAASLESQWWRELLTFGSAAPSAAYFDVDWEPAHAKGQHGGRLLLPVLGLPYGEVLGAGELQLVLDGEGLSIGYFDHRFPMSAASLRQIATWIKQHTSSETVREAMSPLGTEEDPRILMTGILEAARGGKDLEMLVERVDRGADQDPAWRDLDHLLDLQHYRLAFWRMASEELNYRRFFDISELAGLTMENEETFEAVHALPLELVKRGIVTGLRIDHIDGLRAPAAYLERLRAALPGEDFYVVIEKILAANERLPEELHCHGTTGYEVLNEINRLFVDPNGLEALDRFYRPFTDRPFTFENVVYRMKRVAIKRLFPGDLNRIVARLGVLADYDRVGRDFPLADLRRALIEITTCLPVYRTYITESDVPEEARRLIAGAAEKAREMSPKPLHPAIGYVSRMLQLDLSPESQPHRDRWLDLVLRWQQLTGPAMAKGFEDTALYRANRLLSLNEVGSEPDPGPELLGIAAFHRAAAERLRRMPHALTASSTHDTKRSEDVRARLNVLSEIPDRWTAAVSRWHRMNQKFRTKLEGARRAPEPNEEWLVYQTLLGAWPFAEDEVEAFRERVGAYLVKAAREAKMHTNWLDPDEAWENALVGFADAVSRSREFLDDFRPLQEEVAFRGAVNSLAQLTLKCIVPGVPDFYQGTELWDLSLVDPDNRRPVDYERRIALLRAMEGEPSPSFCEELLRSWTDGRVKLYVTKRLLALRAAHAELFSGGTWEPLEVSGPHGDRMLAAIRRHGSGRILVVIPRLAATLTAVGSFPVGEVWDETRVRAPRARGRSWRNVFTAESIEANGSLAASAVLLHFPVAVLEETSSRA